LPTSKQWSLEESMITISAPARALA
jgi:hypothetical protein